ncbi:MAG: Na+/H+ antiporter NhaA [Bdellovibrionales bacterium]
MTQNNKHMIKKFIQHESASGILLILVAILALILDNSPLAWIYDSILALPLSISAGEFAIAKPILLWINDGLMAIFFFLIGLEIKRELLEGELSDIKKATLPMIAALGGLVAPALIYTGFNISDGVAMKGWGIPIATDIAFALGILSLLGKNVPSSLKILLLSLAIIDDLSAIIIIAIFYTSNLSVTALLLSSIGLCVAILLNQRGVTKTAPYILIGVFMWVCVLKSGVHATLAGVLLAFTIPLRTDGTRKSPLKELEHALHPWIAYFIMPIFAFANAGVSLKGLSIDQFTSPLSMGIFCGLFLGKQVGVFSFIWIATKLKICKLPDDTSWLHIYGLAVLCGVGFTMSLFIGTLAFDDPDIGKQVRIAILSASLLSALLGYFILKLSTPKKISSE